MEDIFNKSSEIDKNKSSTIRLDNELIEKLKSLNKGSMNDNVRFLLGLKSNHIDTRLAMIEEEIAELQEKFQKLINLNKGSIKFF